MAAGAAAFLLVLAIQWLLYARLGGDLVRWLKFEAAFQVLVLAAAGGYVLLMLRRHPAGLAWGAPGLSPVVANALALQLILFRLMRVAARG